METTHKIIELKNLTKAAMGADKLVSAKCNVADYVLSQPNVCLDSKWIDGKIKNESDEFKAGYRKAINDILNRS